MLAVPQNLLPVHKNMDDPGGILMRLFKRGVILDGSRIKDHDVGKRSRPQDAAIPQLQVFRRERSEAANGLFKGNDFFIANIFAEEAREISISPGMRV